MDKKMPQNNDANMRPDLQEEDTETVNFPQQTDPFPDGNKDEETASEIGMIDYDQADVSQSDHEDDHVTNLDSFVGWAGLALAILSFFVLPVVLGGAGIIVGFIARMRDATWLGNTAIAVGIISIVIALFIVPMI